MPADGTRHSFLHTNGDFGMSRLRASCSKSRIPRCTTVVPIQLARLPLCRARNARIDSARYEAFVRSDCSLQIVVFDAGDEAHVLERSEVLLGCATQKSHYRHRRLLRA